MCKVLRSRKSKALLPLWFLRPVQSLRACKRVYFLLMCIEHLSDMITLLYKVRGDVVSTVSRYWL